MTDLLTAPARLRMAIIPPYARPKRWVKLLPALKGQNLTGLRCASRPQRQCRRSDFNRGRSHDVTGRRGQ